MEGVDQSLLPPGSQDWDRGDWFLWCSVNSDSPICDGVSSFFAYRISLPANATLLAIFSLSALCYIGTYAFTRRALSFSVAMILGVLCEILGYTGRVIAWQNQWSENGFLMQICCLTIGPAFLAAGIYLCIRRIVFAFGAKNSRIKPEWYTRIFIPCDVVSLVLQAIGGAMASILSTNGRDTTPGDNIMITGLVCQVVTMLLFIIVTADFAWRTWSNYRRQGASALDQTAALAETRRSFMFRGFLVALAVSFVCIFWRCVFRVAELSEGWSGPLMRRQDLFIGFEGVMIAVAVVVLNVFHPAVACKAIMTQEEGRLNIAFWRRKKKATDKNVVVDGQGVTGTRRTEKSDASSSDV